MPISQLNLDFNKDPLAFIKRHRVIFNANAVNIIYGKCTPPEARLNALAQAVINIFDSKSKIIDLDFTPYSKGLIARPILRPYIDRIFTSMEGSDLSSVSKILAQKTTFEAALPQPDPPNCVRGYYFPYKFGTINSVADIGWVDVPKKNPEHKFIFTGSMQGCAIVVTESPAGNDKLRIFHYQSASDNPKYVPTSVKYTSAAGYGEKFNIMQGQGKRLAGFNDTQIYLWFGDYEYGAHQSPEVGAFNFLHYDDKEAYWTINSLPVNMVLGVPHDEMIQQSKLRTPIRKPITYPTP
jgi:hypothetical protein